MKNTDKITLTVGQLKRLISESFEDELDGNTLWAVEYYSKATDEYLGLEFIRAKTPSDAKRKFFAFKREVVPLDYGKTYSTDDIYVPINGIYRAKKQY